MFEQIVAQIGDNALAEDHHKVVARGGRQRERRRNGDHGAEIGVHGAGAVGGETVIDHAAHRERQGQGRARRHRQRRQRHRDDGLVAQGIGQQRL